MMAGSPHISRLALGTVQFGLPYGYGNPGQAVSRAEAARILALAWKRGVDMLDTAVDYGEAESAIGAGKPEEACFKIVSKVPRIGQDRIAADDLKKIRAAALASIKRLKVEYLDALLVHHAPDLLAPDGAKIFEALQALRSEGLVRRLGVSIYEPDILKRVLDLYPIEVVQLPLNLLDQRFARDGLRELAHRGIEVHARSVFLQGVLLADPDRLPPRFEAARSRLSFLRSQAQSMEVAVQTVALGYVASQKEIARIVIGVQSADELQANLAAFAAIPPHLAIDFSAYGIDDPEVIDPRRWTR